MLNGRYCHLLTEEEYQAWGILELRYASEARLRQGQERSGGMTWERFVEIVEARLEEQGLSRDVQIWFIDVLGPHAKEGARVSAEFKRGEGLSIHNM